MSPAVRAIMDEVSRSTGVAISRIRGKTRAEPVVHARIMIAKRMVAAGYTHAQIGRVLCKDPSGTVRYYLGERQGRKPKPQQWRKPHIRFLYACKPLTADDAVKPMATADSIDVKTQPRPGTRRRSGNRRYLIPYAGADNGYVWKERSHG